MILDLDGPLDVSALRRALQDIIDRHDSLRTTLPSDDGEPYQRVHPPAPLSLPLEDLSNLSVDERERALEQQIHDEIRRPFDLEAGPLVRMALVRLDSACHVLIIVVHHVVFDAWSAGILFRDLQSSYTAYTTGQPSATPDFSVGYIDYSRRQREWLASDAATNQIAYWKKQLKPPRQLLALPTDRPRPAVQSDRGFQVYRLLPASLVGALDGIGRREGATLFMTLLAAYAAFLARYTGQDDFVIGSPMANRDGLAFESVIGFFVNTLALRLDVSGNPPFRNMLVRARAVALAAYSHRDLPFESVVEALNPERSLSYSPLVQTLFVLNNTPYAIRGQFVVGDLTVRRRQVETGTSKFDLLLLLSPAADGWRATLECNADLFDRVTGARMLGHYARLLEGVVANPDCPIGLLPLMTDAERHQVLVAWNATGQPRSPEQTLVSLFEDQVARSPEADAVYYGADSLSYAALNTQANGFAHHLKRLGVGPDDRVGLCLDRTPILVAWVLAILKAGGAYVPLDLTAPRERLAFIAEDAQLKVLVTHSSFASQLPTGHWSILQVDQHPAFDELPTTNPEPVAVGEHLVYVMYTSGSTGKPKGVALEHRSLVNLVEWAHQAFDGQHIARMLASTSIGFDVSAFELFVPLSAGAAVVLVDSLLALPDVPESQAPTFVNAVPSVMSELLRFDSLPSSVKVVAMAGEPLDRTLVDRLYDFPSVQKVFDLYGPTETHVATSALRTRSGPVTIGRPIANMRAFVLDQFNQPAPVGVSGELWLAGAGLARGYFGHPDLTAERFVPNPFSGPPGDRLYRTGDRVRWRDDGTLEFIGRLDYQVKLRGFRIELGEIESVLSEHPGVQAAVVIKDGIGPDERLVAYVVEREPTALDQLGHYLKQRLPEHMVPSAYVALDALPSLPNGKVDRAALPAPAPMPAPDLTSPTQPRTPSEEALTRIWATVVKVPDIGLDDSFFDLGGQSFLAFRLSAEISKHLGVRLPLTSLFRNATIREQARLLDEVILGEI